MEGEPISAMHEAIIPRFRHGRQRPPIHLGPLVPRKLRLAEIELSIDLPPYDDATLEALIARFGFAEKHWPYYLENWPATFALATIVWQQLKISPSHSILDLGCGSGAFSCFLYLAYGISPYALDFNPEACQLSSWNLIQNGCPEPLVVCADFTAMPTERTFDFVFGGEILYAQALVPQVLTCLAKHLTQSGQAWFGDARRSSAESFTDLATAQGFRVERFTLEKDQAKDKAIAYKLSWK
jgi:predicted nicotinamide N-methyase